MTEDDVLLLQVAAGSLTAYETIYDQFAPAVFGLARRVVRSEALAQEIAHDALLEVWTNCSAFDPTRGTARNWIMTLAHRRAVNAVRREQVYRDRLNTVGPRFFFFPEYADIDEAVSQNMGAGRLHRAWELLTPLQRRAIQLAYFGGFTHTEVARILGVPLVTAKSQVNSALERFRRELAALERERPPSRGSRPPKEVNGD